MASFIETNHIHNLKITQQRPKLHLSPVPWPHELSVVQGAFCENGHHTREIQWLLQYNAPRRRGTSPAYLDLHIGPDRGNINRSCPEERRLFPFVGSAHCFVLGGVYLFRCKSASKSVTSCPCVVVGEGAQGLVRYRKSEVIVIGAH